MNEEEMLRSRQSQTRLDHSQNQAKEAKLADSSKQSLAYQGYNAATGRALVETADSGSAAAKIVTNGMIQPGQAVCSRGRGAIAIDAMPHSRPQPIEEQIKLPSKLAPGLLASSNNYIQGEGEGPIMAALIAQLLGDAKTWNPPKSPVKQRYVACMVGPTYTPLQPIRDGLAAYGYSCENIHWTAMSPDSLKKYDVLLARVVHVGGQGNNEPFLLGTPLSGIKSMLRAKKMVYLGGCGCPYGSRPLNDVLGKLGFAWSVQETRFLPEESKPVVVMPWTAEKKPIKGKKSYIPSITDRTIFSGVSGEEAIVKSANNQTMMAFSPYPLCLKFGT